MEQLIAAAASGTPQVEASKFGGEQGGDEDEDEEDGEMGMETDEPAGKPPPEVTEAPDLRCEHSIQVDDDGFTMVQSRRRR